MFHLLHFRLTAFVLRVFSDAKEFAHIDDKVICDGLQWLSTVQNDDGSFRFTHMTWHGSSFMVSVLSVVAYLFYKVLKQDY